MAKKLTRNVVVDGRWWGPDDDVPPEVAERITNPRAWADSDEETQARAARGRDAGYNGHRLIGHVAVGGRWYGPDDPVPEEDARRITNPKVWADGDVPRFADGGRVRNEFRPAGLTAEELRAAEEAPGPGKRSAIPPPPRVGRGSGIEPWARFAEANNVDVPTDATRDEIIAACEDAGLFDGA